MTNRTAFWKTLFKDVKTENDLNTFLNLISKKGCDYWIQEYHLYSETAGLKIAQYFSDSSRGHLFLSKKLKDNLHWVGLFQDICEPYISFLSSKLSNYSFIENGELFMESIKEYVFGTCTNMSYRAILQEINTLKIDGKLEGVNAEQRYNYYSEVLANDRDYIKNFYLDYPVLFDLLQRRAKNIIDYILFILEAASKNIVRIKQVFQLTDFKIGYIKFDMGDTHANGKTVCTLVLNNESNKLLFKPRSAEIDESLRQFSEEFCHMADIENLLTIPQSLSEKDYCFVEFIESKECLTKTDVEKYYLNMGKTLAILFLFHSKDYHGENILASGKYPYLIDNETVLHRINDKTVTNAVQQILKFITESVYGTGVLPFTINSHKNGRSMEVGALNSGKQRSAPFSTHRLSNKRTDEIKLENYYKTLDVLPSSPKYKGEVISCENYLDIIQQGFTQIYLIVCKNKEAVKKLVKKYFNHQKIRYIYRNTNIYSQLLETSYHPELLSNAVDRRVYFTRLFEYLDLDSPTDLLMGNHELNQLFNGDVPLFYVDSNSNGVFDCQLNEIVEIGGENAVEHILNRIEELSWVDLLRQQRIINMSFIGSCFIV